MILRLQLCESGYCIGHRIVTYNRIGYIYIHTYISLHIIALSVDNWYQRYFLRDMGFNRTDVFFSLTSKDCAKACNTRPVAGQAGLRVRTLQVHFWSQWHTSCQTTWWHSKLSSDKKVDQFLMSYQPICIYWYYQQKARPVRALYSSTSPEKFRTCSVWPTILY